VNPFAIIARITQLTIFTHHYIMCVISIELSTVVLEATTANAVYTFSVIYV